MWNTFFVFRARVVSIFSVDSFFCLHSYVLEYFVVITDARMHARTSSRAHAHTNLRAQARTHVSTEEPQRAHCSPFFSATLLFSSFTFWQRSLLQKQFCLENGSQRNRRVYIERWRTGQQFQDHSVFWPAIKHARLAHQNTKTESGQESTMKALNDATIFW